MRQVKRPVEFGGQQHTWEEPPNSIDTNDADHNGLGRSLDPMPNVYFDAGCGEGT